jgi:multidrug efflux system outer membrane protein
MRKLSLLATLTLLAGCHLAPPNVRPDAPTPDGYSPDYAGDVTIGARATDIAWRNFFRDPRLDSLIATALTKNRDLAVAVARIDEARGLYRIQNADRYPTLIGGADVSRNQISAANGGPLTTNRISADVTTAFELDFWGRVRSLSDAARANFLATVEAQRAFRLSLIRSVASTYLEVLEANERIQLAEATVQSRRDGLRIAKVRLDAGITSALDYRQSESLLTQAEAELAALRLAKAQRENLLVVLVGGPVTDALPSALPLAGQLSDTTLAAGLPSTLLVARPDIIAAEQQLRAANANIGAARAAFFPSIELTGFYGNASDDLSALFQAGHTSWSFVPTLRLPIFSGGANLAALDLANARKRIEIARYEQSIQIAFREVADALIGRSTLEDQIDAQEALARAAEASYKLADMRYRGGVDSYLGSLIAQRDMYDAQRALIATRLQGAINLVQLYQALGGGWKE